MPRVRHLLSALAGMLLCALQLGAQEGPTGTIVGRVVDATTLQPIGSATVVVEGTQRGTLTQANGSFLLTGVPVGTHRVRASLIGYASQVLEANITANATTSLDFELRSEAVVMEQLVVTGYGTQRREAITGSVATVDAGAANVGVIANANELIQGRAAGVTIIQNTGEPGAGAQVRIRGGTSISASNEPLYVIDGVPIENVSAEPGALDISGGARGAPLDRSPLTLINPSDIASITILKDAAAAAIYGSRAANGVVLIETKRGSASGVAVEYDGYVASAAPARKLDFLTGEQYRQFVQEQVQAGNLTQERLDQLGYQGTIYNTNWEDALTRTATTQNHNLSFSGGTDRTRYRASLNYMNQEGVVLSNGFERFQGRLAGTHHTWDDRLRLGLNLTASHIQHDYVPHENTGGFEGGIFTNMAVFNPTRPVTITDPATGQQVYYETGAGSQSVRNPVALANQIDDEATTTRTLGNISAELDLRPGLTGRLNVGIDRTESARRMYFPRASALGAQWNGLARQEQRDNSAVTLQTLLTWNEQLFGNAVEAVGGYEYNDYSLGGFRAESRNFLTDAFRFNNLGAGADEQRPMSYRQDSRLVSFFTRVNYSIGNRYFVTGVLRRDGSSRFGADHKWATFPAISGSWRVSESGFSLPATVSDLRIRAGWGKQGNQAVPPYASLILLEAQGGARYVFGESAIIGVAPVGNPNPELKWEETTQKSLAVDYGLSDNRITGTLEYYVKNTSDLLLTVAVPQPAPAATRLENIGAVSNRGFEFSLDGRVMERTDFSWTAGLVLSVERNKVEDLGNFNFISSGLVSGQGQSGQVSQRIMPGHPLGTFFGAEFVGVNDAGEQLFNQYQVERDDDGRVISRELIGQTTAPSGDDYVVIGDANPDFTFGFRNQGTWRSFDFSFLIRGSVGNDVFNNTALVYATKGNVLQDRNFLASALSDPTGITQPSIFSSRWIENGSFVRLQNLTVGYTFDMPQLLGNVRHSRVYVSGDNLLLLTGYDGYDPEVHTDSGLASRGIDYLAYPRSRTFTAGVRVAF